MLKMLKNPKQCSRGEPTTMGANMWDAVGQPSWNRSVKKYQKTIHNPRHTFDNFTLLLLLSLFLPAPFPLPLVAATAAAAVAVLIAIVSFCPRFVANSFPGARFSWFSSFSFRLSNASSSPYFLPCWLYAWIHMNTCWCCFIIMVGPLQVLYAFDV